MTAPCKDCPDRRAHCHSCCEKYKEFKKRCDDIRDRERLERLPIRIEIERKIQIKEHHRKKQHHDKKW